MRTKHEVITAHQEHPDWSSAQIARHLSCGSEYVRATLKRNGFKLMRQWGEYGKASDERVARVLKYRREIAA